MRFELHDAARGAEPCTVPRGVMLAAFLLPLSLYWLTLAPTVTLEDSGEFITAAYCLGVAHPPGYPLWCLLAHLFTRLPFGTIAQRVHFCSAFFAAATCVVTYLVALRLTRRWLPSLLAALALGCSGVLWSQAVIAEVYTLNAFLTILAIYWTLRWRERQEARWLYALALTVGLGLGNHFLLGLVAPALGLWVMIPHWRRAIRPAVLIPCALLFASGLLVYAYLPIRARAHPAVNWENPDTLAKTLRHIGRVPYLSGAELARYRGRPKDTAIQTLAAFRGCGSSFTWPLAVLALAGALRAAKRRPDFFLASSGIILLNIVVLNLLLKGTASPEGLYVHRVFYIPAHIVIALWLAIGAGTAVEWTERLSAAWAHSRAFAACRTAALAALLVFPAAVHYRANDRSHYQLARNFGLDYLSGVPKNAGLLLLGDEVGFVTAYLKLVEGRRPDVRLLDPFFDWNGERIASVICEAPLTPALIECFPGLQGANSLPWGLGYRLVRIPAGTLAPALVPLPEPPHDPDSTPRDPSEERVYATYACYHARLGEVRMAEGNDAAAELEFEMSERLNGGDAYATYVLATIYRRLGVHAERVPDMLRQAIVWLDRHDDPAQFRFYPVTRDDIARELASVTKAQE